MKTANTTPNFTGQERLLIKHLKPGPGVRTLNTERSTLERLLKQGGVFFVFFLIGISGFSASPDETEKKIALAIQAGDAAEVSKYFNTLIDLTIPGYDDTFSKAQAGQILKDFFSKNLVKAFKINNQGSSSDGSRYSIGSLEAGGKSYRLYFLIKSIGGQELIQQFQMQENQ